MAILIQNINMTLSNIISDSLIGIQSVSTSVYGTTCNHIEAPGFEAFVFDFSKVISSENLTTGIDYGLIVNNNSTLKELNISY
jgi:hypothetical protein